MPKTYLRYAPAACLGVVASPSANLVVDDAQGVVYTPCLEDVAVWNLKTGLQAQVLHSEEDHGEVTALELRPGAAGLAVGHSDGRVNLWSVGSSSERAATFNGHATAVTTLCFAPSGALLVSGSRDTKVVVWDVVSESGLFRLSGHRDQITAAQFLRGETMLVTSSKDGLVKVWELSTQHCVQTCVGHRGEVWALAVSPDQNRVLTGSTDNLMRVWDVAPETDAKTDAKDAAAAGAGSDSSTTTVLTLAGTVPRHRNERAVTLAYSADGKFVACQGASAVVEVYRMRTPEQVKKRMLRRRRRHKEKAKAKKAKKGGEDVDEAKDEDADLEQPTAADEFELWGCITAKAKVRSVAFLNPERGHSSTTPITLVMTLHNNLVETYDLTVGEAEIGKAAPHLRLGIALPGHRSDVRDVAVSGDGNHILTTSSGLAKLWNAKTHACIRTIACGFGLTCAFGPGDRHALIGTKSGSLQVIDLASGDLVEDHEAAHDGAVFSVAVRPDGRGMVSGGADKTAKFWDFDLKAAGPGGAKTLTLVHTRTLKMADDVLCLRYSHHTDAAKLLLAVSLLDCSIKVFFDDSLKFFLSLYGHKLPVMSMSISSDNSILASGSADKNIKLWGLDFGDCHRSLFAHDDSVVGVAFVPRTHMLFSASKDRSVKYWDGDRFEQILTLPGHKSEVWCLAVSPDGSTLYTGSSDRSIRVWSKTDDIVFLDEEKERRLEDTLEADAAEAQEETTALAAEGESGRAGRRTGETLKAVDRLVEALEFADDEFEKWEEFMQDRDAAAADSKRRRGIGGEAKDDREAVQPPSKNPLFMGLTPSMYVLKNLRDIRAAELEETLHALLLAQALQLLKHLHHLLRRGLATELATKCVVTLLKVHNKQLVANGSLQTSLLSLKHFLQERVKENKARVGFNLAALRYHERWIEAERSGQVSAPTVIEAKPIRLGKRKDVHLF